MYPTGPIDEDPETYRRYVLSHGAYKPGEQKRHYGKDWNPPEVKQSVEHNHDGNRVHAALYWDENVVKYTTLTQGNRKEAQC